jgi:hypothetical protein
MTPTMKERAMPNGVKTSCPVCGSPHIDVAYWDSQVLIGEVVGRQYCQACPAQWDALYALKSIRNLDVLGQCTHHKH